MKVALLVPGPFSIVSGGYGYDRRLVEGFRAAGHEVEVVELDGRHPLPDDAAKTSARAALDRVSADTRIIIDGLGLPAFAPFLAELEQRRAIGLIHHPTAIEPGLPDADRTRLKELESLLFPRMARLVATSRLTAERLPLEFPVDAARIGVVEPGTDPAPRAKGSGGPGCAILSVGVIVPRKGHDVLLRALARLTDLDWHLTIAGGPRDPVHAQTLVALAEELQIASRVTFAGEVVDGELEKLYASADLFALATYWEGYGMAAAEALARGLPVAITAGGAIADVVPRTAGVIAPPGDVTSLSRAMRRPIFDKALRAEMAEEAWKAGQALPRWPDRAQAFLAEIGAASA
ncbi:glycosyltransferase family 4 protein [Roseomonas marmotae]|uniref:Glycosyltransferase family 4 protein n=1 Tax=Roseomonas marmotae TaxID=2768161 RepID=A0ABS3KBF0_9PROT|nr:glycosyltransferase family 4 protein [Roseomonas marmotae]MBO1074775.1 glycosyltransferase family 4 protein [Roseomonas marmotae]QTI80715.1 glycosyltransferase family 4 protein [Roseomonas marmotae]